MVRDALMISMSYMIFGFITTYLCAQVPSIRLSRTESIIGTAMFIFGEWVNHHHHLILADLRSNSNNKSYKVPNRALFQYVWCPHYVGEIIAFVAITLVAQHILVLPFQVGSAMYLVVRAYSTKQWYEARFPSAPKRACLVPYVF
ncbi:hypothetical protein DFQ29_003257 [Apophysomyces sp. BC1021]|nr:hypothetical protein DFQ29_003257 [Apophysomyces sp. BC1021]